MTESVVGRSLSGKTSYVISPEQNNRVCQSLGTPPAADGSAHPIFFFVATQVGMGLTVAELCRVCDFDVEDGPMMASSKVEFAQPLLVGQEYQVRGEIRALTRKASRKFGAIDLLDFQLRLVNQQEATVLICAHVWVLPRRLSP